MTERHRFDRHGNRRLDAVLYRIALTHAHVHPGARAYLARNRAESIVDTFKTELVADRSWRSRSQLDHLAANLSEYLRASESSLGPKDSRNRTPSEVG